MTERDEIWSKIGLYISEHRSDEMLDEGMVVYLNVTSDKPDFKQFCLALGSEIVAKASYHISAVDELGHDSDAHRRYAYSIFSDLYKLYKYKQSIGG